MKHYKNVEYAPCASECAFFAHDMALYINTACAQLHKFLSCRMMMR